MKSLLLVALVAAEHTAVLDQSHPWYLIAPIASRSPNEYLYFSDWAHDCYRDDNYDVGRCVQSDVLDDADSTPPPRGLFWLKSIANEPGYYHIVGSTDSSYAGYMLNFDFWGNVYPKPCNAAPAAAIPKLF